MPSTMKFGNFAKFVILAAMTAWVNSCANVLSR